MATCDTRDLHEQLERRFTERGDAAVELLDAADPVINITLHAFGDMQVQVAASGGQILVSTVLAPASQVRDRAAFNDACMRINPMNPLSNLGLTSYEGEDTYIVFGELSTSSSAEQVEEEIDVLARNTIDAAEALQPYFNGA